MKAPHNAKAHEPYNGWCLVVGIPLRWQDCPECCAHVRALVGRLDSVTGVDDPDEVAAARDEAAAILLSLPMATTPEDGEPRT